MLISRWPLVRKVWQRGKPIIITLGALIAWAAISLVWSPDDDVARQLRRLLFVVLFLYGFAFFGLLRPESVNGLLRLACHFLALSCLVALFLQYSAGHFEHRAGGLGLLEHPILGGYSIAIAVLLLVFLPHPTHKWIWIASMTVMAALIVMTQSRGLWVGLLSALLVLAVLRGERRARIVTCCLLMVAAVGVLQFWEVITVRGMSFRPEILSASFELIQQRPWLGLGIGANYDFQLASTDILISHSHNLFAHIAIELGLVGLLLWLAVWICVFRVAWNSRDLALGRALLAILIFCTIGQLFDGGDLWGSPRADWFFTWLPVGLGLSLVADRVSDSEDSSGREARAERSS